MKTSKRRVKGLGEVSIRVNDLALMGRFYEQVVGLEVLRREENFIFFKIANGYDNHPQILALFDTTNRMFLDNKSPQINPDQSTLHHIALNIPLNKFKDETTRLEELGLKVVTTEHAWIQVRSLYFPDPEGNLLEFVCHDESLQ
jgi:catechol-2,3-dioxygenase